jgi:Tol biopolymer transport system component
MVGWGWKSIKWLCRVLATITLVSLIAVPASFSSDASPAPSVEPPRVTSITQITKDGLSKTKLVADETNLYVTEWPSGRHVITKVPLQGAQFSTVTTPFSNVQALDLSPDGKKLLIAPVQGGSTGAELWTIPVEAGSPERLGMLSGRDAAWSADGKYLAFVKGSILYLASGTGTDVRQLFAAAGSVFAPKFSPDGRHIRVSVGNPELNTTSIWDVETDGSNPHPLWPKWKYSATACCGAWSGDGRYYIFQVTQNSPAVITSLWAIPEQGSSDDTQPVQLTKGPTSYGNPFVSRDGKRVWAIGVAPAAEAVNFDAPSNSFVPLLSGVSASDLDFSADGKYVTYVSIPDATLWRARADGTDKRQLTFGPNRAALPHWSPDGNYIAYVDMPPGQVSRIEIISRDGGQPRRLLAETNSQVDANWSADGRRIMFGGLNDAQGLTIRVVNIESRRVDTIPGSQGLFSPRWSPDGRYVAALSPDFTKLMLFDFHTKKWTTWLSEPAGAVSYPVWSNDSKYLYFDDLVTEEESIRRVKINEHQPERVLVLKGIERYPGAFGMWWGRSPQAEWMFVRDRSTQEVYQLNVELP